MSKQITSAELATIVSALLTNPESLGQLAEYTAYQGFMTGIAKVVTDYCGGEVANPASSLDDTWYVGIHWNDSVPDDGGVWSAYDVEADFSPAPDEDMNGEHDLYKTGDADAPDVIKDRNGEVTLGLCRRCGKGEADLVDPCR